MGCCSNAAAPRAAAAQSVGLHVNYTKGMVLGVDDFTQEFTYLAGRDQRAVRELAGYGTIVGLAVTAEDTAKGPRLRIAAGSAATPGGRLVCLPADQCGTLNDWLGIKANGEAVTGVLGAGSPPPVSPPSVLPLWLTLCYADCLTAPVPIPGEPCRSEDSLMAPSRIADDFRLELRIAPPPQIGEDALRDFVQWLRHVIVVDATPPPPADEAAWLAALHAAAKPWLDAVSANPPLPTGSLHDYMYDSPPPAIAVAQGQLTDFLRVAFRFWTTVLRPIWSTYGCADIPPADADCVLLARIEVPVAWAGGVPIGAWQVAGNAAGLSIDESRRPVLLPSRMLQEWMLAEAQPVPPAAPPPVQLPQPLGTAARPTFAGLVTTRSVQIAVATTGANLTLGPTHHCVVCTAPVTVTLPPATAASRGLVYVVKAATGASNITAAAGSTIGGVATLPLAAGAAATLISDGAATWHVIASIT